MNGGLLPLDPGVLLVGLAVVAGAVSQLAWVTVAHVMIIILLVGVHLSN